MLHDVRGGDSDRGRWNGKRVRRRRWYAAFRGGRQTAFLVAVVVTRMEAAALRVVCGTNVDDRLEAMTQKVDEVALKRYVGLPVEGLVMKDALGDLERGVDALA